jgi:subtilisin family serine protease
VALAVSGAVVLSPVVTPVWAAPVNTAGSAVTGEAGPRLSYVVNTSATPEAITTAEQAVVAAGGDVLVSWPQIGVVVAQSTNTAFATDVVGVSPTIQSAGPTRTAAITASVDGVAGETGEQAVASYRWDMTNIGVDKAHQITKGSRNVLVAVLDSGIDDTHPALAPAFDARNSVNCVSGGVPDTTPGKWRNTTSTHGTHVAGTIAATDVGGTSGFSGVAPGVRIASVKVVDDTGSIYPEYAICGFIWAAEHGAAITNNSYYVDPWLYWCGTEASQAAAAEAVRRAIDFSTRKGVLNVAAAGNDRRDLADLTPDSTSPNDGTPIKDRPLNPSCTHFPEGVDGVVSVSSVDVNNARSSFSNYGLGKIDVAAPGSSIYSTLPNNRYGNSSGTSMASPHVAGVAALLKSVHPLATPAQLLKMLQDQATPMACPSDAACKVPAGADRTQPGYNGYFGYGLVDAYKAVTATGADLPDGQNYQLITADVAPGTLSLTVEGSVVSLGGVTLNGFDQYTSGSLNPVKVADGRGSNAGWNLTGQVSDFVGPNGLIVANNLGWDPNASVVTGDLPVAPGTVSTVTPGPLAPAGNGLGDARGLCSSPAGASAGAFSCGAGLGLGIPGSTLAGTYTGVLTLTLV